MHRPVDRVENNMTAGASLGHSPTLGRSKTPRKALKKLFDIAGIPADERVFG
jgi:hypothetical protein